MKKRVFYILTIICLFISLFYDKQIVFLVTQNRVGLINGFMMWMTNRWTVITIFLLMTTLFLWEEKKRGWIAPLWTSVVVTSAVTIFLKIVISRTRPFESLIIPMIQGVHYTSSAWDASFPSLHAAAAFSLVPILNKEFPKIKWFWIFFAIFISLSRIYVGVHYLSDVIAGALIGIIISNTIIKLKEKHKLFKK